MWSDEALGRRVDNPALTTVWARGRLREMEDRYAIGAGDRAALEHEIEATSLRFGVLCRFTAFVAVDRSEVVNPGGQVHGIVQPVEQPTGWEDTLQRVASGGAPAGMAMRRGMRGHFTSFLRSASPPPPAPQGGLADSETESVDSMLHEFVTEFDLSMEQEDFDDEASQVLEDEAEDLDFFHRRSQRRKARSGSKRKAKDQGPGLIRRLLSPFHAKRGKTKTPSSMDCTPYRQRALDLLQTLQSSVAADTAARLAVLRSLIAKLEELFKDLATAGDRDPSVEALGEAVLRLHTLLAESQPAETDIRHVGTQIENCLQRWLALGETGESPRREGFWK